MPVAKAFWQQDLNRLAQQFLPAVPEHPLHFRVSTLDEPLVVRCHHRIRRGLKNSANALFGLPQGLLDTGSFLFRAPSFCYVFILAHHALRLSPFVPQQREPAVPKDDAAIAANEALFPFVLLALPLKECRKSCRAGGTLLRVNNGVPLLQAAQFFLGVTQHLLQCAVAGEIPAINPEEADPNLGVLENRSKELLACLLILLDHGCQNHERRCREE